MLELPYAKCKVEVSRNRMLYKDIIQWRYDWFRLFILLIIESQRNAIPFFERAILYLNPNSVRRILSSFLASQIARSPRSCPCRRSFLRVPLLARCLWEVVPSTRRWGWAWVIFFTVKWHCNKWSTGMLCLDWLDQTKRRCGPIRDSHFQSKPIKSPSGLRARKAKSYLFSFTSNRFL